MDGRARGARDGQAVRRISAMMRSTFWNRTECKDPCSCKSRRNFKLTHYLFFELESNSKNRYSCVISMVMLPMGGAMLQFTKRQFDGSIDWFRKRSLLIFGAIGTALLGVVATGLANIAWKYAGDWYDEKLRATRIMPVHISILVSEELGKLGTIADFHNLITRFGVDEMFRDEAMATEQDKVDGQRQLLVKPAYLKSKSGNYYLEFELPVHLYLGTQFKIFATPKGDTDIGQLEMKLKEISDKQCDYEPNKDPIIPAKSKCVERGGTLYEKVYFLLDKFWRVKTGGDILNNYVPPA